MEGGEGYLAIEILFVVTYSRNWTGSIELLFLSALLGALDPHRIH